MNDSLAYTHDFIVRLDEPLRVQPLPDAVPVMDSHAHVFRVSLPQGMPEGAAAYAVRPDGVTVVIPCDRGEEGLTFSLPAEALAQPGRVDVLVRAQEGDRVTTLLWCSLVARPGITGELVDPLHHVPSLEELLARIDDCDRAAERAENAAEEAEQAAAGVGDALEDAVSPLRERVVSAEDRLDELEAGVMALGDEVSDQEDRASDLAREVLANGSAIDAAATRLAGAEESIASHDSALAAHGIRLTALEGLTLPDALAALFCPALEEDGAALALHPCPGTTVQLSLASEDTRWLTSGRVLWSCRDFRGQESNYFVTGGGTGGDVPVPPGEWVLSWYAEGMPEDDTYGVLYRLNGKDSVRVNRTGPGGTLRIRVEEATTLSFWFYNSQGGWAQAGYPLMSVMLADDSWQNIGWQEPPTIRRAADSFTAAERSMVRVWTEDGSVLTARGWEDIPHALERMVKG